MVVFKVIKSRNKLFSRGVIKNYFFCLALDARAARLSRALLSGSGDLWTPLQLDKACAVAMVSTKTAGESGPGAGDGVQSHSKPMRRIVKRSIKTARTKPTASHVFIMIFQRLPKGSCPWNVQYLSASMVSQQEQALLMMVENMSEKFILPSVGVLVTSPTVSG